MFCMTPLGLNLYIDLDLTHMRQAVSLRYHLLKEPNDLSHIFIRWWVTWCDVFWVWGTSWIWGVGRSKGGLLWTTFQVTSIQFPILHGKTVLYLIKNKLCWKLKNIRHTNRKYMCKPPFVYLEFKYNSTSSFHRALMTYMVIGWAVELLLSFWNVSMTWISLKLANHSTCINLRTVILTIRIDFFLGTNDEQENQLFLMSH